MRKPKCLILGSGGREASIAQKLRNECELYFILSHKNPTIIDSIEQSNGGYIISNQIGAKVLKDYIKDQRIDMAIVNNDSLLAKGMVDILRQNRIPTFGPTKEGAKIEWSKIYARKLVDEINPDFNPTYIVIQKKNVGKQNINEIKNALNDFSDSDFVIKPDGLTAGKGVKVMGKHLNAIDEAKEYCLALLQHADLNGNGSGIIIEKKIFGYEFTVMGFTDGKEVIFAQPTYDYSYRYDDDNGPGTGGMGAFTSKDGLLPFLTQEDLNVCHELMKNVIYKLNKNDNVFNGVLNGGFFKSADGTIKLMEFNSRIGDPECLNVMELINGSTLDLVNSCIHGISLNHRISFRNKATISVYLVSQNYPSPVSENTTFFVNEDIIIQNKAHFIGASCEKLNEVNKYISVGSSRLAAIVKSGDNLGAIRGEVYEIIRKSVKGNVEWRKDIASDKILEEMFSFKKQNEMYNCLQVG
jgi:phosphoribosylamine--glycine ligase